MTRSGFRFEYTGPTIRSGDRVVTDLDTELDALDIDAALIVSGETVGSTSAVMDPITTGVGDRLGTVFDETTPAKRLGTALDARDAYHAADADGILAVGGGSSLDVAKISALAIATDHDRDTLLKAFADNATITAPPDADVPPIVVVPTTLAGADQSQVAGITTTPDDTPLESPQSGGVADPRIMPATAVYDPTIVATTPPSVLRGSAMNGFDKGIETLYARNRTPITDATASHGLTHLTHGLPTLRTDTIDATDMAPIVRGLILVQYGISRPDGTTLSIIHAFGHGLTTYSDMQQGIAHAIIAPHALEYLFEAVDGRRDHLAEALDLNPDPDPATAVVDEVKRLRNEMDLPHRLRDVDAPPRDEFEAVAQATLEDSFMDNTPPELDPTVDELVDVLDAAY